MTQCHNGSEDMALRAMTLATHLLKGNPLLKEIESMGKKDPDYTLILHTVRTGGSVKSLPPDSEGSRMGGEWAKLDICDHADIIVLDENHGITKIFPLRSTEVKS